MDGAATSAGVLILPGLGGSGEGHWQSIWEAECPSYVRVQQRSWCAPELDQWLSALEAAVDAAPGPAVLVAHSLSCVLVAHFAARYGNRDGRIAATLLVAPADVESKLHTPPETRCFAPIPRQRLPFASTVAASHNDPFMAVERARELASDWGAQFVDVGEAGHINAESGLGQWAAGRRLLEGLIERVSP